MPYAYSPEYRKMVLAQVRAGRRVAELADELEVSESTMGPSDDRVAPRSGWHTVDPEA